MTTRAIVTTLNRDRRLLNCMCLPFLFSFPSFPVWCIVRQPREPSRTLANPGEDPDASAAPSNTFAESVERLESPSMLLASRAPSTSSHASRGDAF